MTRDDGQTRDRSGELIDAPDHDCDDGWTHDLTGRPRPCPVCRPETLDRLLDQRDRAGRDWLPLAALRERYPTDREETS